MGKDRRQRGSEIKPHRKDQDWKKLRKSKNKNKWNDEEERSTRN